MNRKIVMISSLVVLCATAILLLGCPPPVVRVRPPAPRVEVYGSPPYPEAVWRPGHWDHRRGEWFWIPGHWARPPRPRDHWVPGHWEERRGGWVWREGHWGHRY